MLVRCTQNLMTDRLRIIFFFTHPSQAEIDWDLKHEKNVSGRGKKIVAVVI